MCHRGKENRKMEKKIRKGFRKGVVIFSLIGQGVTENMT